MPDLYRLSWEMPNSSVADEIEQRLGRSCWPAYDWDTLTWHRIESITEEPWQQHRVLNEWAITREQPIRNVRLEKQVSEPVWEDVDLDREHAS